MGGTRGADRSPGDGSRVYGVASHERTSAACIHHRQTRGATTCSRWLSRFWDTSRSPRRSRTPSITGSGPRVGSATSPGPRRSRCSEAGRSVRASACSAASPLTVRPRLLGIDQWDSGCCSSPSSTFASCFRRPRSGGCGWRRSRGSWRLPFLPLQCEVKVFRGGASTGDRSARAADEVAHEHEEHAPGRHRTERSHPHRHRVCRAARLLVLGFARAHRAHDEEDDHRHHQRERREHRRRRRAACRSRDHVLIAAWTPVSAGLRNPAT